MSFNMCCTEKWRSKFCSTIFGNFIESVFELLAFCDIAAVNLSGGKPVAWTKASASAAACTLAAVTIFVATLIAVA